MDKYIGKLLDGRYEILELIGTGGMANVYKGRCRLLNRYVAIKILKDEFAQDDDFRERFHNESQAVAMLGHHNIVSVYDVSKNEALEYIVMELVDGITLKEYLKTKGKLDWKEVLMLGMQISAALNHAHSRGIIHQDIKPHNILLLKNGEAKVTDFGIARLISMEETRVVKEAIGSVHYMAPEQAKGGTIDQRTDLYSLGIVLYEMLTGRLPFEADNPLAIVVQHLNAIPLMPSELFDTIPKSMDEIVMKAMSPVPDRRYTTAEEIYRDLIALKTNPDMDFGYNMEMSGRGQEDNKFTENHTMRYKTSELVQQEEQKPIRNTTKTKKESNSYRAPIIITFIVLGLFLVGAIFLFKSLLIPQTGDLVSIPDFTNEMWQEVVDNSEYDMFSFKEAEETIADDLVESGTILKQEPESGKKVEKKGEDPIEIVLTLSKKQEAEQTIVPNIVNLPLSLATIELARLDIEYMPAYENSDTIESEKIIRTTPEAGKPLEKGERLIVIISKGADEKIVTVPELVGMTEAEARAALEELDLKLGTVTKKISEKPEGQVLTQSIPKDVKISVGSVINIEVAKADIGKATITVLLPEDEAEEVLVEVFINGLSVHSDVYQTSLGTIKIPCTGKKGTALATVVVGDQTYETIVEFK